MSEHIKGFSPLAKEALGEHYVYALVNPRDNQIFYVGQGQGDRVFSHEEEAKKSENREKMKLDTIKSIEEAGMEVDRYIINCNLTKAQADAAEGALINALNLNLPDDKKLTNIQSGNHSMPEAEKVEDFEKFYAAEPLKFEDLKGHKVLVIKITSYKKGMTSKDVYDIGRGIWKLDLPKAKKAEYVFIAYMGVIVGVFRPTKWYQVSKNMERANALGDKPEDLERKYFIDEDFEKCGEDSFDENQNFWRDKKSLGDLKRPENKQTVKRQQNSIGYLY